MTTTPGQDKRIELKYSIDESLAQAVREWACEHLGVDPHCCETLIDSYDVNTLYLDSPELDLYHRTGVVGSTKHRIRRYGQEEMLWLECKRKKQDVVRKSRTAVPESEVLERLPLEPRGAEDVWCGEWFAERVAKRKLIPTVQVHYRRFARMATLDNQSLRLTIDSQLQASRITGWHDSLIASRSSDACRVDISPAHILELKFHNHTPVLFKQLLCQFALPTSSFSKYRTAVGACELVAAAPLPSVAHYSDSTRTAATIVDCPATDEERLTHA